nr:helicase 2 [Mamestra brassicae multiple nucleopolyhedrovirus]
MKRTSVSNNDSTCSKLQKQETNDSVLCLHTPQILNEQQQKLFDYVVNRDQFEPIFVSGSAGTGKSALLKTLKAYWQDLGKHVWVVSYTHLAARNVDGQTIHRQFGFDLKGNLRDSASSFQRTVPDYLIVDEISMVSAKMLEGMNIRLQRMTDEIVPFGGVNTLIFGDLYQLPPISNKRYGKDDTLPPFKAPVWSSLRLYELTINMRQSETDFIEALNMLRVGNVQCLNFFNQKALQQTPSMDVQMSCTSLVSTHAEANAINARCYKHLQYTNKNEQFELQITQKNKSRKLFSMVYNKDQEQLIFKDKMMYCVGTRVMVTFNLKNSPFCNGDIGVIVSIDDKSVRICREADCVEADIAAVEVPFELAKYSKTTVNTITGIPITYAWAVTIHKAQGMTTKNLIVYPQCIFEEGQAYVALSRVTHCDGLKLVCQLTANCVMKMEASDHVYNTQPKLVL